VTRKTSLIAALVLAGAGALAWYAFREEPIPPEQVVTAHAKKTTVVKRVRGVGHIEPVNQVNVSANVSGDLIKLHVDDGDSVKRGQLLAEIKREQWAAIVRQNEAAWKSTESEVALQTAQLEQAIAEQRRTLALYAQKLTTDAEIERVKANVAVIQARLDAAKQKVLQAEAALEEARTRLKWTEIYAPIDGTVISLKKKEGERIRGSDLAEDVLLTLAPLNAMLVRIEVSEQDVVGVKVGQESEITVDALGKKVIAGRVMEILNSAIIRNPGTEQETTNFQVKIALEETPDALRSGMSASIAILSETHKDVIAVPIEAVTSRLPSQLEERAEEIAKRKKKSMFQSEVSLTDESLKLGRRERPVEVVFVAADKKSEPRKVKTSISSETEIEVTEGLEAGAEVIVGPYKTLSRTLVPGTPIDVVRTQDKDKPSGDIVAHGS
jgi:HlyD family secretion protein